MGWLIAFLLIAWPTAEITVFIMVAEWLGWGEAILLIVMSGVAGISLLRANSLAMATDTRAALNRGEMPMGAIFDGACTAVAGILLIIPGFLTDLVAGLLLLPPVRLLARGLLASRFRPMGRNGATPGGPSVIEGEWQVVSEEDVSHPRDDGAPPPSAGCAEKTSVIASEPPESRSRQ